MTVRFLISICLIPIVMFSSAWAAPEKRVALVIGNGAYQSKELPKLENPTNDAEDIAKALRSFGFDVIAQKNTTRRAMKDAIAEFGRKAANAEAALLYFAGHGVQIKGRNYLMPVDATARSEADIADEGIDVNYALEELDNAQSRVNIVMLDACRDNPVTGKFRGGGSRGLAPPASQPKGTVIVYATDPGNTAADGEGRNGLFTSGLLAAFREQDLSLDGILTSASARVEKLSQGKQTPYVNGPKTLQKNFSFKGGDAPRNLAVAEAKPAAAAPTAADQVELTFWDSVKTSSDAEDFQEYLRQYPQGKFAGLANIRLKKLQGDKPAQPGRNSAANDLFGRARANDAKALADLKHLAEKGDALAQMNLGRMYSNGLGLAKDDVEAVKWFRKAANQGYEKAQGTLGFMYSSGRGVPKDEVEAAAWYRKAADQGAAPAQSIMGTLYATGRGVPRDDAEAVRWFRKAADQAFDAAEFNLGRVYHEGRGVERNDDEARKWFGRAAEKGHRQAQEALMSMSSTRSPTPPASETAAVARGPSPKEFCTDRPNFISRSLCERRECEKPENAKDRYCEQYLSRNEPPAY